MISKFRKKITYKRGSFKEEITFKKMIKYIFSEYFSINLNIVLIRNDL